MAHPPGPLENGCTSESVAILLIRQWPSEKFIGIWRRSARVRTILIMSVTNADDPEEVSRLLRLAADGDQAALMTLFSAHRIRLKRMIQLRLSRRVEGRVDASDVLQEAFLEASRSLADYARGPVLPFFLWLRHLTALKLSEVHRRHLGTKRRDADREVTLHRGGMPMVDSASLAAQLLGSITSPSCAVIKAETRLLVQEVLYSMDPVDREVLALRHFEQLSTSEVVQVPRAIQGRSWQSLRASNQEIPPDPVQIPGFDTI